MKKLLITVMLVMPTIALAQSLPQPAEYNLKVSPGDLDLISKGLGSQPFNDVVPLMNKLRTQVMEQQPKPDANKPVENKVDEQKK